MIVLLHGKDAFRIVRRRTELRTAFSRKYPDGIVTVVDASGRADGIVVTVAEAGSGDLFSSERLVDVREACAMSEESQRKFVEYLKVSGGTLSLLVSETTAPAATKHPVLAYLKKHADRVETFEAFETREAASFLESELKRVSKDVSFFQDAKQSVLAAVGSDSARLSSLAETLALYRESGEISAEDVAHFVTPDPRVKIFDALDALLAGNRGRAASLLLRESRSDGGVIKTFGLLAWQMRELFRVRGEYDRGNTNQDDIARVTGMKPFVAGKLLSKMGVFPLSRLRSGLALLADLDVGMKTGTIEPELALTLFVEKL